MSNLKLDGRLCCAAELVRQGAVLADIGTDHGYLPLFLLEGGRIEYAYLADINEGPLLSAKRNADAAGLLNKCRFILSDGLASLPKEGITDITICGMGGELIARIIDKSRDITTAPGTRLILQPMSREAVLREYLFKSGFRIICERYSYAANKYYLTLLAEYDGIVRDYDLKALYFGEERHLLPLNNATRGYLLAKERAISRAYRGRCTAGEGDAEGKILLDYINKILEM